MTLLAQTPSLRAGQASLQTCAQRAERAIKMQVSDCVDTALTRARQARLPSPWTEAVDFLDLGPRASEKVEHWRARLLRKTEKIDSLWTGRGIWTLAALKNALCEYRRSICASTR